MVAVALDPKAHVGAELSNATAGINEIELLIEACARTHLHIADVVLQVLPTSTNTPEKDLLFRVNTHCRGVVVDQQAAHLHRHSRPREDDLLTTGVALHLHDIAGSSAACLASTPIRQGGRDLVAIVDDDLHRSCPDLELDVDLLEGDTDVELPARRPQPPTVREPTPLVLPVLWPDQASMLQIRGGNRHNVAAFLVRGPRAQASALAGGHRAIAHLPNLFEVVDLCETNGVDGVLVEAAFDDL
mmetsp:Transcript_14073/g.45538  ORF Transcript_14073/g.45538 Transcript_14073/m.45538 type:complete len:244 (+) Transcript_14073:1307-2038(+)